MSTNSVKGLYKIESQISAGKGKITVSDNKYRKTFENAFSYLKINSKRISGAINISEKEFYLSVADEKNVGNTEAITLGGFIAMCSISLNRQLMPQTVILGEMALSGSINAVSDLASTLQIAREAGAKKALIPILNAVDMSTLPPDILMDIQPIYYQDPIDATQKALGLMKFKGVKTEYRAITAENFYLIEMKNTCKFILKNKVEEDLKKLLKINNILETVSESNFSKKFNTINKRLKSLTDNLKKQIVDTDLTSARFINLYSILCNERFILEFLEEVVKEKYDNSGYYVKESDFSNYMETKSEQSKVIQNWTAEAKRRMLIKVKNFLTEGGYLEKNKEDYKIIKPIVDLAIIDEIKENGNKKILKIMFY